MSYPLLEIFSKFSILPLLTILLLYLPLSLSCSDIERIDSEETSSDSLIILPAPELKSSFSVEEALQNRRSIRRFKDEQLDLKTVSQILWSAQGITLPERGYRTAPSAGAAFPLETYIAVNNIEGLQPGLYQFIPDSNTLGEVFVSDIRNDLSNSAMRQTSVRDGAFVVVLAAVYERITGRYGERGIKYTHMEVGHVGQNIHLQAESLGLGTVVIGAFNDDQVQDLLRLPEDVVPLYLMPIGQK